jgi:hypothetical protein
LAKCLEEGEFKEIVNTCLKNPDARNRAVWIQRGEFSLKDYIYYWGQNHPQGGVISQSVIEELLKRLTICIAFSDQLRFDLFRVCMPVSDHNSVFPQGSVSEFTTTHWSAVLLAGCGTSAEADKALEDLCRAYWYPLYAYVRRQGHGPEDSQDLTQAFFARFLEKDYLRRADPERGRFRTFLLSAVKNFLTNEWERGQARKRRPDPR